MAHFRVEKTDAEWKRTLAPFTYEVLRHAATERPFSSPLNDEHRVGIFHCAGCNWPVYSSKDKFESGTGWPSFTRPLNARAVGYTRDDSLGMQRTAVHCASCGGHLGHVFDDGPPPTGKRYCMNGVAMTFQAT
jgi:peptide-methionine (R)-S-oxide reductase